MAIISFKQIILFCVIINIIYAKHSRNDKNEVQVCECMGYWSCIDKKGLPYSYCGHSQICCLTDSSFGHETDLNKDCGIKGRDLENEEFADPGEWAWHGAILEKSQDLYICGASLVHNQWVLTAAHCVHNYLRKANSLKLRFGEYDVTSLKEPEPYHEYNVDTIFYHPKFDNVTLVNDIALMRLSKSVNITLNINKVCLSRSSLFTSQDYQKAECYVTGWGKPFENTQFSRILKEIKVPLWSNRNCELALKKYFGNEYKLPKLSICAGRQGKDACDGDGGGPLSCKKNGIWFQLGIVSYGIGCGRKNSPGVYTDVTKYWTWINQVISTK